MSDQVQLSAYTETVQNLIESKRYDEAIAVCHHILSCYPKNITTYRQMAKAHLEKGNLQDAAELFRRVLSADPEDDCAYTGLAVIFEQQALIDEAVWHLERAFELRPGSLEIRNELLRLYGERDGRPPGRLKLTPGALGRLYVREGLFNHAIQEFRTVLAETPRRLDARLALAESLWRAGQVREASEISQELLQALPYCLKANLILGMISQESEENDGETYLNTAQALDPTNRVAQELLGEASPLPTVQVFVPQYVEGVGPAPQPFEQAADAGEAKAPDAGQGFDEWFGEGSLDAEISSASRPSEAPSEGEAATETEASFEELTTEGETAQEPGAQEPTMPSWVSESSLSFDLAEMPATEQPLPAESEAERTPQLPGKEPELPAWLQADADRSLDATPPSDFVLPSWLAQIQETAQTEMPGEPAVQTPTPEISLEPALEPSAEPTEMEEAAPFLPVAEEEASPGEPLPTWTSVPPPVVIESDSTEAPLEQGAQEEAVVVSEASVLPLPAEPSISKADPLQAEAVPLQAEAEGETIEQFEEWFEETKAHVAAEAAAAPAPAEKRAREETPDWLKGLEVLAAPETPAAVEEEPAPEAERQPTDAPASQVKSELVEESAPLVLPQEPTEGTLIPVDEMPTEEAAVATGARSEPVDMELLEAEPVQPQPQSESPTVTLSEEEVDRELYGEGTLGLETQELTIAPAAGEMEPIPTAPSAQAETEPDAAEAHAAELVRSRRDPKGYAHLERARALLQDHRLGEALKEYDYLVQHSPRLVGAVIEDLERLIREWEVPLEAHRILGDAYTRVDRLAQALECYRFVLQRVS